VPRPSKRSRSGPLRICRTPTGILLPRLDGRVKTRCSIGAGNDVQGHGPSVAKLDGRQTKNRKGGSRGRTLIVLTRSPTQVGY
jgi:hypothetical protein